MLSFSSLTVRSKLVHIPNMLLSALIFRKAVEELLKEAKRGKLRAETMGAMGW